MKRSLMIAVVLANLSLPLIALAQKVGGGDLTFTPKNVSLVVFSHERHMVGKGLAFDVKNQKNCIAVSGNRCRRDTAGRFFQLNEGYYANKDNSWVL